MSTEENKKEDLSTQLKPKQRKFCEEYIVDYRVSEAAIRAGYPEKSAAAQGSRLLKNAKVAAHVRELQKQFSEERCFESKERLIQETWKTYEKATQIEPVLEWDKDEHKYVETGLYQFDGKTAVGCLKLLGTYLGVENILAIKNADESGFELSVRITEDEREERN